MDINLTLLGEYFDKVKYPVCFLVSTDNHPSITVQAGKPEMNGGLHVTLELKDLDQILRINNIIGPGSKVDVILKDSERNFTMPGKKIDNLIYKTLVDYISQMLSASRGQILNPAIIPLAKHKDMYFRESSKS